MGAEGARPVHKPAEGEVLAACKPKSCAEGPPLDGVHRFAEALTLSSVHGHLVGSAGDDGYPAGERHLGVGWLQDRGKGKRACPNSPPTGAGAGKSPRDDKPRCSPRSSTATSTPNTGLKDERSRNNTDTRAALGAWERCRPSARGQNAPSPDRVRSGKAATETSHDTTAQSTGGHSYFATPTAALLQEEEMRIHPRTAKELAMVEESPECLIAPALVCGGRERPIAHYFVTAGKAGKPKAHRGHTHHAAMMLAATRAQRQQHTSSPTQQEQGGGGPSVMYGEDAVLMAELRAPENACGEQERIIRLLAVLDGHGMRGREAVKCAAERLLYEAGRTADELFDALLCADVDRVRALQTERYAILDSFLEEQLRSPTGGTTCSAVELVGVGNRLFLVVSNVGDSPVLVIDNRTRRVSLVSGRHAWDNPVERKKYLDRCARLGLPPREVVYGRINCGGMRMLDLNGGMSEPLFVYKPGTAEVCETTREHLCEQVARRFRSSIGGSQSIRRFLMEKRTKEGWVTSNALQEHGHVNWGSTVLVKGEGKIQMTRSLGDMHEKQTAYIFAEPDCAIYEFGPREDVTIIACSDGLSDLFYLHELGEMAADFFESRASTEDEGQLLADLILRTAMERGEVTPGYGVQVQPGDGGSAKPKWDDVSLGCIRVQTLARHPSSAAQPSS